MKKRIVQYLSHFPKFKKTIHKAYYSIQGVPPISYSSINSELLISLLGKANPNIVEIGCNDGTHTLWFKKYFPQANIYCFEPDSRALERFKHNVGQIQNVHLFDFALSDKEGKIEFYQSSGKRNEKDAIMYPGGWDASGSIKKPKFHLNTFPSISFTEGVLVKTKPLDSVSEIKIIDMIDLIWMDVQGAEFEVLHGATLSLTKTRYIYTEYNDKELYENQPKLKQLLNYLKDFSVVERYPGDILLENKTLL